LVDAVQGGSHDAWVFGGLDSLFKPVALGSAGDLEKVGIQTIAEISIRSLLR
jgi:hypothetical protein